MHYQKSLVSQLDLSLLLEELNSKLDKEKRKQQQQHHLHHQEYPQMDILKSLLKSLWARLPGQGRHLRNRFCDLLVAGTTVLGNDSSAPAWSLTIVFHMPQINEGSDFLHSQYASLL